MGEAKRRRDAGDYGRFVNNDAPEVRALLKDGEPMSILLVGAAMVVPAIASIGLEEIKAPQHRALRLAFQTWDRMPPDSTSPPSVYHSLASTSITYGLRHPR
jgi:hypothetical protein